MKQKVLYILLLLFACAWNTQALGQTTYYVYTGSSSEESLGTKNIEITYGYQLSFDCRRTGLGDLYIKYTTDSSIKDKSTWKDLTSVDVKYSLKSSSTGSYSNINIPSDATGIRFEAGASIKHIKNIKVTRRTTLTSSTKTLDFGSTTPGIPISKTISVGYNNTYSDAVLTGTSTNGFFTVTQSTMGETGSKDITITYTPTTVGNHNGTVTLTMGTPGKNNNVTYSFDVSGVCLPMFNFTATSPATTGGSATAEIKNSVIGTSASQTSASTTAKFSATPNRYYKFLGWGTFANATSYVSIENPYQPNVTNNTPGSTQNISLYAIFEPKTITLDPTDITSLIVDDYKNVTLNRTLKQGYNTLSLPFDTNVATLTGRNNSDDWVAQLALVTYNGNDGYTLYFTKVTNGVITANQPYILHLGAELVNPSWTNMTVVAAQSETISVAKNYDWSMISNYTPNFSMEGKYGVVNSTGKIQKGANGSTLNAFTAYFTYTGAANVKAVVSYLDNEGELTKIEGVDFDDSTENETIYDLQGRKVEKPDKGIYIINGKKIHK